MGMECIESLLEAKSTDLQMGMEAGEGVVDGHTDMRAASHDLSGRQLALVAGDSVQVCCVAGANVLAGRHLVGCSMQTWLQVVLQSEFRAWDGRLRFMKTLFLQ
jgi:hypothetical protein